ncbi:glycine cleavage system aminomethyltransferase GcvT [soil metagenome]
MTGRASPLHAAHRRLGAKFATFGGWEMPLEYTGTIAEHLACRERAAVFDVSHLGTVRLEGADAHDRLQAVLTNDLGKIGAGRAQYTHLLDPADGSVLDDIIVWWHPDGIVFDVMPNASNTEGVQQALGGRDITDERAVLAVQGPLARRLVESVVPGADTVRRFRVGHVEWHGVTLTVAGTGYTGEDGLELAVPSDRAVELWDALVGAGVVPAGLGARDTLRLEAALPLHGHELGPGITPLQAGLGWVVAFDKSTFHGREALLAERERGVHRHLVGIATEGRRPPRAGSEVLVDGARVGECTSGNFSPVLGHGIALAFVAPDIEPPAAVEVMVRGSALAGGVVDTPFVTR